MTLVGQNFIDVEKEKFSGVKKLIVEILSNVISRKKYSSVYYFDNKGNAIKSSKFRGNKCITNFRYQYNAMGLLIEEMQTYYWKCKKKNKITKYFYELDTVDRIISRTKYSDEDSYTTYYQDFDDSNNPQTIIGVRGGFAIIKKKYDAFNRVIAIEVYDKEKILDSLVIKYNEFGDEIYSYSGSFLNFNKKEDTEPFISDSVVFEIESHYEYLYDLSNRWIEKYLLHDNNRLLLRKRIFYDRKSTKNCSKR